VIANPVDKRIYKHTLSQIEKDKEQRRKATVDNIRNEYEKNDKKRFNLATEKLPSIAKNDQVIKEVNDLIEKEIRFEGTKPRVMPNFEKYNAPVKLNAASVMREGLAIKKFHAEEQRILKELEMNHRDATEFERWKREMNEKDEVERLEHI